MEHQPDMGLLADKLEQQHWNSLLSLQKETKQPHFTLWQGRIDDPRPPEKSEVNGWNPG